MRKGGCVQQRPPQKRVLRNHARVLDAALVAVAADGRPGLTYTGVAALAGLSRRPVQERYPDLSGLAAALWVQRVTADLETDLRDLLDAGGTLGSPVDEARLVALVKGFARPTVRLRAASELLLVSQFDAEVRSAVDETLGAVISGWCAPGSDPATGARRAFLLSLAFGMVLLARRRDVEAVDLSLELARVADALRQQREPVGITAIQRLEHVDQDVPFDTGDPTLDALLRAVLEQVGRHGFDRASVEAIARAAGCSQGALFSRFSTKIDVFLEATARQQQIALEANHEFIRSVAAEHGVGIAEATALREFMRPGRDIQRAIALEQLRVSWYDDSLAERISDVVEDFSGETWRESEPDLDDEHARARFHVGLGIGTGALVLPLLSRDAWQLPYDVMTIPLNGS